MVSYAYEQLRDVHQQEEGEVFARLPLDRLNELELSFVDIYCDYHQLESVWLAVDFWHKL